MIELSALAVGALIFYQLFGILRGWESRRSGFINQGRKS